MKQPSRKQLAQGHHSSGTLAEAGIDGANYPPSVSKPIYQSLRIYQRDPTLVTRLSRPALVSLCIRMLTLLETSKAESRT